MEQRATKADVEGLKADVKGLKADVHAVDAKIDRVALELVKTQGVIGAMEDRLGGRMVAMESRILTAVDDFLGQAGHSSA